MILTLNDVHNGFSIKWLIGIFVLCCILFSVARIPASIVGSSFNAAGVKYHNISGTIWNGSLNSLTIAGESWRELEFSMIKLALLTGRGKIKFFAKDIDKQFAGQLEMRQNSQLVLHDLSGSTAIRIIHNGVPYNATLTMNSDHLETNSKGECVAGQFDFRSEFLVSLLAGFSLDMPPLAGKGECREGTVSLFATSEKNGITISVVGEISQQAPDLVVDVTLPESLENNPHLLNELTAAGFNRSGPGWQSRMEIS